jgi:hypothetical protein
MLRRLAASARHQDWFAVTVELVVVVLGIFIGMQVANWNDDRKMARLAEDYRASLLADLEADEDSVLKRVAYYEKAQSYGMRALEYLDAPEYQPSPQDASDLVTAFMLASTVWEYRQSRSTFEDLKATGNIALIGSMPLRVALANYYVATDQAATQWDMLPDYRRRIRSLIPAEAQPRIMSACEKVLPEKELYLDLDPHCKIDLAPWAPDAVLASIRRAPGMHEDLTYWMSMLRLKIQLFGIQAEYASKMRQRVQADSLKH